MISIGVVARQTGVDVSTLRKWETRYGFPRPLRRDSGQRAYRAEDVVTLHMITRRVAAGERIGQVIRELLDVQASAHPRALCPPTNELAPDIAAALHLLQSNDLSSLRAMLEDTRQRHCMLDYVNEFIAPLTVAVGTEWAAGRLPVYVEHFYSALLESQLIRETALFATADSPRVLLVSPAGEKHTLGLAMTHAVLAEAGISCLRIFSDLPATEIAAACAAHQFAAVGLSASVHYSPRILREKIARLRRLLPPEVQLWLGGGGINRVAVLPAGASTFASLADLIDAARPLRCAPTVSLLGT